MAFFCPHCQNEIHTAPPHDGSRERGRQSAPPARACRTIPTGPVAVTERPWYWLLLTMKGYNFDEIARRYDVAEVEVRRMVIPMLHTTKRVVA